jgi:pimeloyl-ACP methyl ester carboxylesterase
MHAPNSSRAFGRSAASRLTRRQAIARCGAGVAAGALITSGLSTPARAQTPEARVIADDFTGPVDIGGRLLYFESAGSGSPTVVLEAGLLGRSDVWSRDLQEPEGERQMVFPAVAEFTHVCTYDRPGTIGEVNPALEPYGPLFYPSRSDPVPMPRTFQGMAVDIEAVLKNAGQSGPFVLVGHSLGGLFLKYYAMTRPDDVAGLVLVDATTEGVWDGFREVLSPDDWAVFEPMTVENTELKAAYPEAEFLLTAPLADDPNMAEVRRALREMPLKPMPMVVLTHGIPFDAPFPGWPVEQMEQVMLDNQMRVVQLVPGAKHIIAEESGHNIHQDQPELVIEAIRMVVDAVRDPSTWTS